MSENSNCLPDEHVERSMRELAAAFIELGEHAEKIDVYFELVDADNYRMALKSGNGKSVTEFDPLVLYHTQVWLAYLQRANPSMRRIQMSMTAAGGEYQVSIQEWQG